MEKANLEALGGTREGEKTDEGEGVPWVRYDPLEFTCPGNL